MSMGLSESLKTHVIAGRLDPATAAGKRLSYAKHVLGGKERPDGPDDRPGGRAELKVNSPHAYGVTENGERKSRGATQEKLYRRDGLDLAYHEPELPGAEGGLMRYSPGVNMAAIKAANNPFAFPINRYPPDDVDFEFIELCRDFFRDKCGMDWADNENIAIGVGTTQLIDAVMSTFIDERVLVYEKNGAKPQYNDHCLGRFLKEENNIVYYKDREGNNHSVPESQVYQERARDLILGDTDEYHSYSRFPEKWGGEITHIKDYTYDGLKEWWDAHPHDRVRVKMLFFSNPTASAGRVRSREELEGVAKFAKEHDLFVLSDEIYRESVYDKNETPMTSIASIDGMANRTATTYSLSKDSGVPNIRMGWMAAPKEVVESTINYSMYTVTTISFLQQLMAKEGLMELLERDGRTNDVMEENVAELQARRDLIKSEAASINDRLNDLLKREDPKLFDQLNNNAKALRQRDVNSGLLSQTEFDAMDKSGTFLQPIHISVPCNASHSIMMDFEDLKPAHLHLANGREMIDSLDSLSLLMDFGVAISPTYSTGSDTTRMRFVFGQFGDEAFYVQNARQMMELQGELFNEAFDEQGLKPDPNDKDALKHFAKTMGYELDDTLIDRIQSNDDAYAYGKEKLGEAMTQIEHSLTDLIQHRVEYKGRASEYQAEVAARQTGAAGVGA